MEATALWIVLGFRDSRVQGLQGFVSDITYTRYTLICVCRYIYMYLSLSLPYVDLEYVQFIDTRFSGAPGSKTSAAHSCS